ncbi:D-beta-hydroxybutyrate dehydrogenase-like [Glandiceps talaboti]
MYLMRRISSLTLLRSLSASNRTVSSKTGDLSRIHYGKVALVTGSSDTGGIGFAIARSLAKRGCSIILSGGRDSDKVVSLRKELEGQYEVSAHYIRADLNVLAAINTLYDDVKHIYAEGLDTVTALETLGSGVTCNSIAPAMADTVLVREMIETKAETWGVSLEEAKKKSLETYNPSGQLVGLDQIGELSTFLCSPAADQTTGSVYVIDAGLSAR